jgi:hypothetical protein
MASGLADFQKHKTLDDVFGKSPSEARKIHLYAGSPGPAGSGGTELSGTDYAAASTVAADWNVAASGAIDNANEIAMPVAGTGGWTGTADHWAVRESGGQIRAWGEVTVPRAAAEGDLLKFPAGTLTGTITDTA